MHLFIRAILEVEGARGYDITAVGLLTEVVYSIGPTNLSKQLRINVSVDNMAVGTSNQKLLILTCKGGHTPGATSKCVQQSEQLHAVLQPR